MKKYLVIIIVVLIGVVTLLSVNNQKLTKKYETSIENIKAYNSQLNSLEGNNRLFKLTIQQLNYFNDSIIDKLKLVQKELGIKDKRLKQLQYDLNYAVRKDTILLRDTIFNNPNFELDTIVGDKWFQTNIHLKYPNKIVTSPSITLERYTFITGKKETVNPPKKFFLWRWFQKKHIVVEVIVKEKNPYVVNKESKYIEIIK